MKNIWGVEIENGHSMLDYIKNKFGYEEDTDPDFVTHTPMEFKLKSMIDIDDSMFVVAESLGSEIKSQDKTMSVVAIGNTELEGAQLTRVYLEGEEGFSPFLQVLHDSQGVGEVLYFHQILEYEPQTRADWKEWIGEDSGRFYQDSVVVPEFDKEYTKVWQSPLKFTEVVAISDTISDEGVRPIETTAALFVSELDNDLNEYVLIQIENGENVCTYVGVNLTQSYITVI